MKHGFNFLPERRYLPLCMTFDNLRGRVSARHYRGVYHAIGNKWLADRAVLRKGGDRLRGNRRLRLSLGDGEEKRLAGGQDA